MESIEMNNDNTPENNPDLFRDFEEMPSSYHTLYPKYWSPYKTAEEKIDYQKRLPTEIQPFIRGYFRKHKDELSSYQNESVAEYLNHTMEAWDQHIQVNRQIDCFLSYEKNNIFGDWSPKEWGLARRLLVAGMETDHIKAMYSGGIKKRLDSEAERLEQKYKNNPEVSEVLMTPSFFTFYVSRELDYQRYFLSNAQDQPSDKLKKELIEKYCSGDERVFENQLSEIESKNRGRSSEQIELEIDDMESVAKENARKKMYAMMDRPDVRNFDNLLKFDNTTEYEYTYSLKGLPDLFLREEILRRLVEKKKIEPEISVFSLTLDDFKEAIDTQIREEDEHFTIRLRKYRQHFDTCGTACIMSILNRKGFPLNEEMELKIWEMVGQPYNFPGGLAEVLLMNKFNVTYIQDKPELLDRNNPEFTSMSDGLLSAAKNYISLFEKAFNRGLKFQVEDWSFERVQAEIRRGNPCIIYLYVSDTVTHVVLAHGMKGNLLEIMDPLGDIKYLSMEELNRNIIHPMGKRMLKVDKLPDDFFSTIENGLSAVEY